jgi:hypothetical protein
LRREGKGVRVIRRNVGTVLVATALVVLILLALGIALTIDHVPELALYISEDLFGIILAVFVLERVLARREERRWLAAKKWLYVILLETIDDLLRRLLPPSVPGEETEGEIPVYEVTGNRVHFGEVVAYGLLRLLVSPGDKDLQSHVFWYAEELEPLEYASRAKAALSEAREQIRDTFASSARLMEADITAMLMNLEQAIMAAIEHMDSAISLRNEQVQGATPLGDEEPAEQVREADHRLAFATSIIIESVVGSAMKPKAWLEAQLHHPKAKSPLEFLQVSDPTR